MEGCHNDDDNTHSIAMCKPEFYATLKDKMETDPGLHVAFLGDYFDQGLNVHESIKGMSDLYDAHLGRVFIILGNRDVNKLRFMFELTHDVNVNSLYDGTIPGQEPDAFVEFKKGWSGSWNPYYHGLHYKRVTKPGKLDKATMPTFTSEKVDLVKLILQASMGAGNTRAGKHTGLYSFVPPGPDQLSKTEGEALEYLKASLNIGGVKKDRAMDLLKFYRKCKIAHVFDGGNDGKVLLSHGGGFDPDSFFSQDYVQTFYTRELVTGDNYLEMLEKFRKKLSTDAPNDTVQFNQSGGEPLDARSRAIEYDEIRRKYPTDPVQTSVRVYNNLLRDVLDEVTQSPPVYTWKFVLLQALGLKPDVYKGSDTRYNSLIQSCSQNGCLGPSSEIDNTDTEKKSSMKKLSTVLKKSGITHVSYGHKPVCFPLPVIYSRNGDVPGITFISNDTSNGNRKKENLGESTVVGTSITFNETLDTKVEAMSIINGETSTEVNPKFKKFLDATFTKYTLPPSYTVVANEATKLGYYGVTLKMNNARIGNRFLELEFDENAPENPAAAAVAAGGGKRRKKRYSKKQKYVSKRKRSSSAYKGKKTRRAKKARRATRK